MSSQVDVPSASTEGTNISIIEEPTKEELKEAYRLAVASRSVEEHIVRLASRGDVKFSIWGPGEEIHGTATALALKKVVNTDNFGIVPHYRSGCLVASWCALNGLDNFTERMLRQQFSKATDEMSGGRQMVYHLNLPEANILPVQSAVGMQLGKAAGYALGMKIKGVSDGVAIGIIGDGTTAEGDMHDAMNAASVWDLPVMIMVTDNGIAISTTPEEGRGIVDFESYARGFGIAHFSCDGSDFWDVYRVTAQAAIYCRDNQRACLLHVKNIPRFNGHSSAADMTFDLSQADPIIAFGQDLVERGVLKASDIMKRVEGKGRDFFSHHELGGIMAAEDEQIRAIFTQVRQEPDPDTNSIFEHIYAPFPDIPESQPGEGSTQITYAGAIRAALDKLISRHDGVIVGQDVGKLGGVMTATAGLQAKHPGRVIDAPLNEPLIMGTATGLALHESMMALPEIQFGDYSLNTFHWLVYAGNLRWSNLGKVSAKMLIRMPTDPFGGGAIYHSMSLDGFYSPIPGLVIITPSTSFDAHGLMLTAGDYDGPVLCLEPKWLYRQNRGPAFPGEPTDAAAITALKKSIMRGVVPEIPDVYVPFSKGIIRRPGADITLITWGRAVWTSMEAAETLAKQGISLEVIDLRTIVPPDMELVYESVGRTSRLLVASEDRTFAGYTRQIQGAVVEKFPGLPTRALGQKNVPGIAQSLILEAATILTAEDVVAAAQEILEVEVAGSGGWSFVPPRYFIS
jgi:2-oxoisovalerate dehydrogenase E1 component